MAVEGTPRGADDLHRRLSWRGYLAPHGHTHTCQVHVRAKSTRSDSTTNLLAASVWANR